MKNKAASGTLFGLLVRSYLLFTLTLLLIAAGLFWLWNVNLDRAYQPSDWNGLLRDPALSAGSYQDLTHYLKPGQDAYAVYDGSGKQVYASAEGFDASYTAGELACITGYDEASVIDVYDKMQEDGSIFHLLIRTSYADGAALSPDIMALDEGFQVIFGGFGDGRTRYTQREYQLLSSKELFRAPFRQSDGQAATVVFRSPPINDETYFSSYQSSWKIWLLFLPLYLVVTGLFIWQLRRKIGRPLRRLNDAVAAQAVNKPARVGDCGGPREIRCIGESFDRFADRLAESEAERQQMDQDRQKLIADISHDLKTPITVIAGYIDAICDGKVPLQEQERYLRAIQGKAEALTELVNAFHEYSKVEHPEFVLHPERTDLCEFLREYLAVKYDEIDLAGFTLEVSIPERPIFCSLDPMQFRRVLDNLLSNSLRHNRLGTLSFRNLSNITLKSPVATLTPSEGITIVGGSFSFTMSDISGKKTETIKVKIKANSTIPSPAQSLGVDLKFNYYNNVSFTQGSVTDKVSIPALGRESVPQPVVLVTRSPMANPIAPGETTDVTVYFQNTSTAKLVKPVVTITPSESLVVLNDAATFLLSDIEAGKTASIQVKVKALKSLSSTTQTLNTELKYGYDNGGMITQVTASDKVVIPSLAKESVPQPVVLVTRNSMDRPINPGETVSLTLTFQNAGTTKLISPAASVTPSDSLTIANDASTFLLPDIEPGKSAAITVKIKAAKDLSAATQSLSTELKYSYDNGETITQATASDRLNLTANVPSKADQSVPNLVIRSFTYGGESVAAGAKFPLDFTFENTGSANVENVVVTVDGGECFTMDGSTNTYFYRALTAGGSQSQQVPMRAVPTGKTGAQSISVSFKYEYTDGEKRTQATSDIKLSVPVYQPDRFQINAPSAPEYATVGEEIELTLSYVNKGKDDIANLEATVVGEDVDTPARTQYLGNVTAGANGNVGFAISPNKGGEINVVLKISYENADQQVQTREFPIKLTAEEYVPAADGGDESIEESSGPAIPVLPILIAAGAAAAVIAAVVIVKKKKAAQLPTVDSESWDDWDDTNSSEEE